jgi:hypothetical protein
MKQLHVHVLFVAGVVLLSAGCGGGKGTVPVKGTVKLDGKPLARATVLFVAQTPGGRDATGSTDANGVFRLTTFEPGDGALPGNYKVVIQPTAEADGGPPAATIEEAQQAKPRPKAKTAAVPAKYTQPNQTTLTQDVPPNGEVVFDLQTK